MTTTLELGSDYDQIDPLLLEQLPTLPGTALAFLRLCDNPNVGVADVAAVAQRDPALLARILQVANSPFYAPREPVTEGFRAAAILGLRNLKLVGVGFAILGDLWSSSTESKSLAGIIGASTMAGSGSRSFSSRFGTGRDEEAMTAGLLSFVGELALMRCHPAEFGRLWDEAGGLPSAESQREAFGTDGARLGAALLDRWSLPMGLRHGTNLRLQSMDRRLARSSHVFDAALGFGTSIAELLTQGEDALEELRPAARSWGLDEAELMNYWSEFRLTVRRVNQQLNLEVGSELDSMIVEAKEEYQNSMVRASTELDMAHREIRELRAENERLQGLSLQDPLTGIANRPAFTNQLRASLSAAARDQPRGNVAVIVFDLDGFKQVNDNFGHPVGDRLLQEVASAGVSSSRLEELFARWGGDEFAMVLRPKSAEELAAAGERIRVAMTGAAQRGGNSHVTVSAGAALMRSTGESIDRAAKTLVNSADEALYIAKRSGRNRVSVVEVSPTGPVRIGTD